MMRAALISLWFNLVLFIFKLAALILVHSLAIMTDFAITVIGLTVSIILYKSLKLSNKPADYFHNYGYGKVEHVCEAIEGIVLIGIGLIMSFQAVNAFFRPSHVTYPVIGLASSLLSLSLNFIGAYLLSRLADKSKSPAVKAESLHYRLEGYISAAIAAAFVMTIFLKNSAYVFIEPMVDPIVTLLVSVVIMVPSIRLMKQAFRNLLDASIEEHGKMETITRLFEYANDYCNFKDVKTRKAGHKKFIEMKLIMPADLSLAQSYAVTSKIENGIACGVPNSEVSVIGIPCHKDCGLLEEGKPCPYL